MQIDGKITGYADGQLVIDMPKLEKWQIDNLKISRSVNLDIDDNFSITIDQRKKAWAMLHDISEYTGYTIVETEQLMKIRYIAMQKHPRYFSLSNCSRELATDFIQFLINFCLEQSIPFTTKVFDEIQQSYKLRVQLLKHRICNVCGHPNADVDHVDTIGSGRNRRVVNQVGYRAWSLCRKHHEERHKLGVKTFAQKYQVKPVKLTANLIDYLNLANKGANDSEVHRR